MLRAAGYLVGDDIPRNPGGGANGAAGPVTTAGSGDRVMEHDAYGAFRCPLVVMRSLNSVEEEHGQRHQRLLTQPGDWRLGP
jgi:hypothetical protein